MRQHTHLRALPSPHSSRPVERVDSAPILLRLAEHGDRRKMNAAFMAAIAERNEVIVAQREQLDEMAEDRDAWRQRALAAEARLRRPSLLAGWWALLAMGWVGFWDRFETPESRRGIAR